MDSYGTNIYYVMFSVPHWMLFSIFCKYVCLIRRLQYCRSVFLYSYSRFYRKTIHDISFRHKSADLTIRVREMNGDDAVLSITKQKAPLTLTIQTFFV